MMIRVPRIGWSGPEHPTVCLLSLLPTLILPISPKLERRWVKSMNSQQSGKHRSLIRSNTFCGFFIINEPNQTIGSIALTWTLPKLSNLWPPQRRYHIFFKCFIASNFWKEVQLSRLLKNNIDGSTMDSTSWMDCWKTIKNKHCATTVKWDTLFPFCLWQIWKNRNSNIFENKSSPVNFENTYSLAVEHAAMTSAKKEVNNPTSFVQVKWNPPKNQSDKVEHERSRKTCTGG